MALTHLVLIAACLSILLPVLWTARSSFATKRVVYDPGNLFFSPTLENYTTIFRDDAFLKYFWNSLWNTGPFGRVNLTLPAYLPPGTVFNSSSTPSSLRLATSSAVSFSRYSRARCCSSAATSSSKPSIEARPSIST